MRCWFATNVSGSMNFFQLHHPTLQLITAPPKCRDKWFATYHNGTEEDTRSTRERKKEYIQ